MGFYVSNRLKSTAASFEEDFLSTIVKSTLCSQEQGLDLSAVRCRESCHYCGLSDVALGAPLCRTPNEKEWREAFPHAVHDRTTYMIAEFPEKSSEDNPFNLESRKLPPENTVVEKRTKFVSVRVRVGGELVSSKNRDSMKNFDSAMQQVSSDLVVFCISVETNYFLTGCCCCISFFPKISLGFNRSSSFDMNRIYPSSLVQSLLTRCVQWEHTAVGRKIYWPSVELFTEQI